MVLASSCLPQLHHAINIDGEAYWDGGYTSNPPVLALAELGCSRTLLVLRINPIDGDRLPRSAPAIRNRTARLAAHQTSPAISSGRRSTCLVVGVY